MDRTLTQPNEHPGQAQDASPIPAGHKTKTYRLENLGCANCAAKMERKLNQMDGVSGATITFSTKQLRLSAKDPDSLLEKVQEICSGIEDGVRVVPQEPHEKHGKKEASTSGKDGGEKHGTADSEGEKNELPVILLGGALFLVAVILHQFMGQSEHGLLSLALFLASYLILGGEVLLEAGKNILKGQVFDENFLMSIATIGAFAIQEYPEAVGVMLFFRIGEYFEDVAVERSRSQIMDAVDLRPEVVQLEEDGQVLEVPAEEAKVGDIVLVRPGDRIPLDGVIVDGSSRIDTSAVTGEPVPVGIEVGDQVLSGCMNISGVIRLKVEKPLSESMVSRILDSVENAAASKPKIDHFITRFSRVYTPAVVAIALLTAIGIPLVTGQEWYPWVYTALSFLVMSCPCAVVLSVPLAFFCGIGAASKQGILFKGGVAIEALQDVKAIVMDKTGTITKGDFSVQSVETENGWETDKLISLAASCEQASTHPIASSILAFAKERGVLANKPQEVEEISGKGVRASVEDQVVLCGNAKLMRDFGVDLGAVQSAEYGSEVLVAVDGTYAGRLVVADTVKDGAKAAIAHMAQQNMRTVMLTGDALESANKVAEWTGVEEVHARLLPEDKLGKLGEIRQKYGSVMFVGDGINDAPVLAGADVGAAMGSGADAAIEAADVVFMNSNMDAIPSAVRIARRTNSIARENVLFAIGIKLVVLLLGITGIYSNMWLAVFADTGVAFLCILNSVRILATKKNKD